MAANCVFGTDETFSEKHDSGVVWGKGTVIYFGFKSFIL